MALIIYGLVNRGKIAKDFSFKDQLCRSTISISSNIAEGFERGSIKEFIQYLYIAKGSAGELRSQVIIAHDLGYISEEIFKKIIPFTEDISRQLSGFIKTLKSQIK